MSLDRSDSIQTKACCGSLYSSPVARLLLGESLHPGGLGLTHRLGRMAGLQPGELVLDVACGQGVSAQAVARAFKCAVVGLDMDRQNLEQAKHQQVQGRGLLPVSYVQGDGESLPFANGAFNALLCECSMSLFPDKVRAARDMARCLQSGARLALSDVTVEPGALPPQLEGTIGQVLCMAQALPRNGYRQILESAGLVVQESDDATPTILNLLEDIKRKLGAVLVLGSLRGGTNELSALLAQAEPVVQQVESKVREGAIGYWLFVARKP